MYKIQYPIINYNLNTHTHTKGKGEQNTYFLEGKETPSAAASMYTINKLKK
jgi:hypothetical protein